MTASRIGRGALVTLAGAAASLAGAAGAANACEQKPPPPKPCTLDTHDVTWAQVGKDGKDIAKPAPAAHFTQVKTEPQYGFRVELTQSALQQQCTGSVDISLASYNAEGPTWETSGTQSFVDFATVHLTTTSKTSASQVLTVKLPGVPGGPCFGQIDLYPGSTKYDGTNGHGIPNYHNGVNTPKGVFAAWNGADAGGCTVVTPPPPPVTTTTPPPATTTPPTTAPTTHPSTPVSSTTPPPPPRTSTTTSTPTTPPTTTATPGTPTLAETGSNAGELSLVALAFFGAGGTAMFASRKAKAAEARKH
ncbi:hypothetical protein Caci_5381 [Catenulispora acidiphila DSM 44928]|uniref:LPXTG-motif cell wall anchor domain protein n=1 Tax=Catenulispora acidiphila (strain DSM 44928 / JCM 14897 / NBRC 102108 / NRRL B-24433 / ID139908) TaxID=479433 RepID=C7Q994_CATAD|nr:hypothetical protein [Catenulispora acidiphila]ACU74240.1 hypothetical protein Caci_5381 [Catenulispora acidiphila DSM 44928]